MLKLKDIKKDYLLGENEIHALRGLNVEFREKEFVAILGPSGCGKTTLLNIIGGLDQYSSGDLIINGKSTKEYKDRDWDHYRNHSIGFVFQSYNLIPHQNLLSNVELALTISGISKEERRERAKKALEDVGLADQIYKKPNQISGGQSQRVAIARALVSNPDIILADEPTGALDSETSVQVMDILEKIAEDKLVVMVTHNPDLATRYANRIVKLKDGELVSDSNPYSSDMELESDILKKRKTKMGFLTAFSLSLRNLLSKKGRTILTAMAGSIGIIGIALIFALSNGIQTYIDKIQEETLTAYPIAIEKEVVDTSQFFSALMGTEDEEKTERKDEVYSRDVMYQMVKGMSDMKSTTNHLEPFIDYLEKDEKMQEGVSTVHYSYALDLNVFTTDPEGNVIEADVMKLMENALSTDQGQAQMMKTFTPMGEIELFEEIVDDEDSLVSPMIKNNYEIVEGDWPKAYDEILIVMNKKNEIADMVLYSLGIMDPAEVEDLLKKASAGEEIEETEERSWSFEDIMKKDLKLVLPGELYSFNSSIEEWVNLAETDTGKEFLYENEDLGVKLKISGIIRQKEDSNVQTFRSNLLYTSALTDYIIEENKSSEILETQEKKPEIDVFTNLPFMTEDYKEPSQVEKSKEFQAFQKEQDNAEKIKYFEWISGEISTKELQKIVDEQMKDLTREEIEKNLMTEYAKEMNIDPESLTSYVQDMDDESLFKMVEDAMKEQVRMQYRENAALQLQELDNKSKLQMYTNEKYTDEQYAKLYDEFMPAVVSEANYTENMQLLGNVDLKEPTAIYLYSSSFKDKDLISDSIASYNKNAEKEDQITYTDYVALLMSSITTILSGITYVLIAFVAISLIVSSIMIGIITYISVLERTKEIGILRAMGASKRDVSNVFNAETVLEGLAAGLLGIGVAAALTIAINAVIQKLTNIEDLRAILPWQVALALVVISVFLTVIAGLVPARMASKMNPVDALRSE